MYLRKKRQAGSHSPNRKTVQKPREAAVTVFLFFRVFPPGFRFMRPERAHATENRLVGTNGNSRPDVFPDPVRPIGSHGSQYRASRALNRQAMLFAVKMRLLVGFPQSPEDLPEGQSDARFPGFMCFAGPLRTVNGVYLRPSSLQSSSAPFKRVFFVGGITTPSAPLIAK